MRVVNKFAIENEEVFQLVCKEIANNKWEVSCEVYDETATYCPICGDSVASVELAQHIEKEEKKVLTEKQAMDIYYREVGNDNIIAYLYFEDGTEEVVTPEDIDKAIADITESLKGIDYEVDEEEMEAIGDQIIEDYLMF